MRALFLVGRALFGGFFLYSGLNHFQHHEHMAGYAASKGVPAPTVAVLVSGALLAIGGLSLLLGYKPHIGAIALVLFLLPVSVLVHNFWAETGQAQMMDMTQFMKNMGLLGSALMFLAIPRPWPFAIGERRSGATAASASHPETASAGARG